MSIPNHYIPNSLNSSNKRKQKKELEKSKKCINKKNTIQEKK